MNRNLWRSALVLAATLAAYPGDVLAGRGGGRGGYSGGGGERGGGGGERGGYGGGQMGGSSMGHSPSFSQPRPPSAGGSSGQRQYPSGGSGGSRNGSSYPNAGAAAAGAGASNKNNKSTLPNNGAAAAGAGYENKNNKSTLPNNGAAAAGAGYENRNSSTLPNNGAAAAGAGYANRNNSTLPNNGAAAAGAGYANRNNSTLPNNGAGAVGAAAGAGYSNRNNGYLPNNGAGAVGAAAGANYANRNNNYSNLGAAALGASVGANSWNNNSGAWGMGGYPMGYGGVGAWGTGSPQYGWGYSNYSNPYSGGYPGGGGGGGGGGNAQVNANAPQQGDAPAQASNYSQPISTTAPPPEPAAADSAASAFDGARQAFMAGNYDQALTLDQQALAQSPNDPTAHQFLALTLFAQGKYEQAAAPLYAVLSVGPGWDWTTLSGMYPDVATFTTQLRQLEAYVGANRNSAPARFVLGYIYLCEGQDENAVRQFREITKLQPGDTLSAQLVAQYHPAGSPEPASAPASAAAPGPEGKLAGTWTAQPVPGAKITLVIGDDGGFTWTAAGPGKPASTIAGSSSLTDGVLSLAAKTGQDGALAGNLAWKDADHFNFRLVSSPAQDPGLNFAR